jgi:hypothetical protein
MGLPVIQLVSVQNHCKTATPWGYSLAPLDLSRKFTIPCFMSKIPFQTFQSKSRVAYVEDAIEKGSYFPMPIQIKNFITDAEEALVTEVNRVKGVEGPEVSALIKTLAESAAPHNGGDPKEVGGVIVQMRDRRAYIEGQEKYLGLFTMYCAEDFQLFKDAVGDRSPARRMLLAAQVHALLGRIPAQEGWKPEDWKTDDALNPEEFSEGFLIQFSNLYYTEQANISSRYLRTENINGEDVLVYKWVNEKDLEDQKKEVKSEKQITEERKTEKKKAEAIAGKS